SMAPAFSAKQLASTPSDDWITNGGSISNDRYSALDRINTSNVAQLKGIWHIHLKSGVAAKNSGEAQPLEYKGVIYTITGADDVFAIDAKTGGQEVGLPRPSQPQDHDCLLRLDEPRRRAR